MHRWCLLKFPCDAIVAGWVSRTGKGKNTHIIPTLAKKPIHLPIIPVPLRQLILLSLRLILHIRIQQIGFDPIDLDISRRGTIRCIRRVRAAYIRHFQLNYNTCPC